VREICRCCGAQLRSPFVWVTVCMSCVSLAWRGVGVAVFDPGVEIIVARRGKRDGSAYPPAPRSDPYRDPAGPPPIFAAKVHGR
jgi:hypothetical protein